MRACTAAAAALLIGLTAPACAADQPRTEAGCGLVEAADVTALTGPDTHSGTTGSVARLKEDGETLSCRTTSTADERRYVAIEVERHPDPFRLDGRSCNAGWVYAGTPEAYAPACQETTAKGSRTMLVARAGDYLVHVTIGRPDRKWAGDPEVALAMSDQVKARLG